jgi:penicillin-binding protein 1A
MSDDRRRRKGARKSRRQRAVRLLLLVLLLSLIALLSSAAGLYFAIAGNLPSLDPEQYQAAQTTKIFTDGPEPVLLAELHGVEDREIVEGDQIPQHMRDAVVAVEDARYYQHQGVDLVGIFRALVADVREGEIVQGGSTITQQFIKNAYITDEKTLDRKVKEAALAYQLEKQWSKDKILNEYLNIIYFGEGAYGVEAAAKEYFGKHAQDLTVAEAALLAGITKSPSHYSPRRDAVASQERRDLILNKMFQQGMLTGDELQAALATDVALAPSSAGEQTKYPYWVEFVREQLVDKYGSNTVLQGGLRVYTSLDLDKQAAAEEVIGSILNQPGDPEAALVSIDVKTGRVVAMVGGRDFATQKFNVATQGHRQPGSAFKTFVLATALREGIPPTRKYPSGPVTVELPGDDWKVKSRDEGDVSLASATADSINGTYARLIMEVGADKVVETARRMGIDTELRPDPAIALGGLRNGVTPMEMAVAYGTLASGGFRLSGSLVLSPERQQYPITVTRIVDSSGEETKNNLVRTPVLEPAHAYLTTETLKGVIERGTGRKADLGRPAAGKTGTTQEYRDAWFVGYTPELVTAVWVGYREEQKEMVDVHGVTVTGGSFPAEIWAAYMKKALEGVPVSDFAKPDGTEWVSVRIDPETGLLATDWCPKSEEADFLKGAEPTEHCDVHGPKEVAVPELTGKTLQEAEKILADLRLELSAEEVESAEAPAGTILAQDPAAGTELQQGKTVKLKVAKGGPAPGNVPGVTGKKLDEARALLEAAGFRVEEKSTPDEAAKGLVLSQDPRAGAQLEPGGTVTLTVSAGPPGTTTTTLESPKVTVPGVVGLRLQKAIALLGQAGLSAAVGETIAPEKASDAGTVASQNPAAGSSVVLGSVISLAVYGE